MPLPKSVSSRKRKLVTCFRTFAQAKGQCAWLKPPGTHDEMIAANQACAGNAVKQMAIAGRQIADWQCRELKSALSDNADQPSVPALL